MELHQLRGFMAVVQEKSFTKAAEKLHLTQPALSLQIKGLESELGEALLDRRNRSVYLTAAGEVVFERGEEILQLVEQIHQDIDWLRGLQTGRLRIGTSDTTAMYLLPPLLQDFRTRYPQIEIHLFNRTSQEVVALLGSGEIDFGIVTLPVTERHIEVESLVPREDVLICAPHHPLAAKHAAGHEPTLHDLVQYPLLLLEAGSTSRTLFDQILVNAGAAPRIVDLGSIEVIKRYVEVDLGISIVPAISVAGEVQAGRLHANHLPWLPLREIGLVQRRQGYTSPATKEFLALLRTYVSQFELS